MVQEATEQFHMMTVLHVESSGSSRRLTDVLDLVMETDLENLLMMTVAVDDVIRARAPICLTQRLLRTRYLTQIIVLQSILHVSKLLFS